MQEGGRSVKNPVILKSYPDGIAVWLDDQMEFGSLLRDVAEKFRESSRFFGDMKAVICFEGRKLDAREESLLADAIGANSRIKILCVAGKDEAQREAFRQMRREYEELIRQRKGTEKFYRGTLQGGQILETDGSIVILGDVEPGCSVISTKDIIVLGKLMGSAYAGGNGCGAHFIAALEMAPQKLKIGDFNYKTKEKGRGKCRRIVGDSRIAFVRNGEIQMQAITKELPAELFS